MQLSYKYKFEFFFQFFIYFLILKKKEELPTCLL